jgi:hypothetical protein
MVDHIEQTGGCMAAGLLQPICDRIKAESRIDVNERSEAVVRVISENGRGTTRPGILDDPCAKR